MRQGSMENVIMIRTALIAALGCVWAWVPIASLAQMEDQGQEREKPRPFETSRTTQTTGSIQAVSQSDRHLVLLTNDGSRVLVTAGENVSDFDKVRPGDRVSITYHEGVIAEVKPAGEGTPGEMTTRQKRKADEMPTKGVGQTIATTVKIQSVDPSENTVTFTRPDGIERTLEVQTPEGKEFINQLKPGDEVQVTYREASAVSIKPAAG